LGFILYLKKLEILERNYFKETRNIIQSESSYQQILIKRSARQVIPALRRLSQENFEFKASLGYIASSRSLNYSETLSQNKLKIKALAHPCLLQHYSQQPSYGNSQNALLLTNGLRKCCIYTQWNFIQT
jgi:hypothetical protein